MFGLLYDQSVDELGFPVHLPLIIETRQGLFGYLKNYVRWVLLSGFWWENAAGCGVWLTGSQEAYKLPPSPALPKSHRHTFSPLPASNSNNRRGIGQSATPPLCLSIPWHPAWNVQLAGRGLPGIRSTYTGRVEPCKGQVEALVKGQQEWAMIDGRFPLAFALAGPEM